MKIRFLADYDFNGEVIDGLVRREPDLDIEKGHHAGLQGLPDPVVLSIASTKGRVLITHDRRTMPFHFADFLSQHDSPGVVVVPQQMAIGAAIEELLILWSASDAEEWKNRIMYLPL